ncbi:porin [Methylophilus sp. TWE2]|uniref:porin n=1 Tax=Methylophilus sp. TWE2 TaxID=1662285 RepID=UPI000A7FE67A|nr:porin [Methylophilus sp. TWE2]
MRCSISRFLVGCATFTSCGSHADEMPSLATDRYKISGYLEAYYSKDFNQPASQTRPGFIYSYNKHDSAQINLALIKASLDMDRVRARVGIGSGTYMRANYAAENGYVRNIYEANVGFKLLDRHDVWLDVGVMPSHIGFESAIGAENWTLTRSMMADNSPYFETGARVSYTSPDGKWYVSGVAVNGWQRINRPGGNSTPSLGHQVTYKPHDKLTLNSSSFIGNDKSDQDRQMRYFHNFYAQLALDDNWAVTTGFDIGAEQRLDDRGRYNVWYTPNVIVRYRYSDRLSVSARAEYYRDKQGVIISTRTPDGFNMQGYSVNMDYKLYPSILLRAELKQFISKERFFDTDDNDLSRRSLLATTALAITF